MYKYNLGLKKSLVNTRRLFLSCGGGGGNGGRVSGGRVGDGGDGVGGGRVGGGDGGGGGSGNDSDCGWL